MTAAWWVSHFMLRCRSSLTHFSDEKDQSACLINPTPIFHITIFHISSFAWVCPVPPTSPYFPSLKGSLVALLPQSSGQKWHFWGFHTELSPFFHVNKKNLTTTPILPHFP